MTYYLENWYEKTKLTRKQKAKLDNEIEYMNTLNDLTLKALNRFTWKTNAKTWNSRMLEMSCITRGSGIIAKYHDSIFCLISTPGGLLNQNGDPVKSFGTGLNGFTHEFNLYVPERDKLIVYGEYDKGKPDAVLVKENEMMYPLMNYLQVSAKRIADIQRSLDVIAETLKSPRLLTCDENRVQDVKSVLDSIDINVANVVGIGSLPYDKLESIDTGVSPQSLQLVYDYLCNEKSIIYEKLGLNSNPSDNKRERLITSEVSANDQRTQANIEESFKCRKEAADYAKELWPGLELECLKNEVILNKEAETENNDGEETEENEDGDTD